MAPHSWPGWIRSALPVSTASISRIKGCGIAIVAPHPRRRGLPRRARLLQGLHPRHHRLLRRARPRRHPLHPTHRHQLVVQTGVFWKAKCLMRQPTPPADLHDAGADNVMFHMVLDRSFAFIDRAGETVSDVADELVGVREAEASENYGYGVGGWPHGPRPRTIPNDGDCSRRGPSEVNHFHLFEAMGEQWAGCVEARPEPFDTSDTPPGGGRGGDTRWVPYLWPDERDGVNGSNPMRIHATTILPTNNLRPNQIWNRDWGHDDRQRFVWKYNLDEVGGSVDADYSSFIEQGPNAACPEPIVPLTGSRAELDRAIDGLRSVGAAGTNSAFGMVWGWRVLSPGVPFTQGLPYDPENTRKIIILMTDGVNDVTEQRNSYNRADYGAYGYLRQGRLGNNRNQAQARLDRKLREVCSEVQRTGREIMVYTVMFDPQGGLPPSLRSLYRDCATEADMFFQASDSADLVSAFNDIAADIRRLRLTQ
jgi:hypothetical protein